MRVESNNAVALPVFVAGKSEVQRCPLCDGPAPWEDLCGECQTLREVLMDPVTYRRR